MPWHDASPWSRKRRKQTKTPEQRLDDIERRCRAGDIGLSDAIRAAFALGQATEQARLIPGANAIKEAT